MTRICLDSTVLVDLSVVIDEEIVDSERIDGLRAVRQLGEVLRRDGFRIVVPAPAVAEILSVRATDASARVRRLDALGADVAPLDRHAAELAADVYLRWRERNASPRAESERSRIRVDSMIVAVAQARRCDWLVTRDAGMIAMAAGTGVKAVQPRDILLSLGQVIDDE